MKEYAKTGNATEAAARVYDVKDRKSAGQIGYENSEKLDISRLMDKIGLTDDRLLKVLKEGLKATYPKKMKVIRPEGPTEEEVPDHPTRHKFLDTALKLKDRYPAEKHKHDINTMPVPGLVDLLHKYGATGDQGTTQGNSKTKG